MSCDRRMLWASLWVVLVVCLGQTTRLGATEVVVTQKSGRQYRGELVAQTEQAVILLVDGKRMTIRRSLIRGPIEPVKSAPQVYQAKRALLKESDMEGRYKLIYQELYEKKAYDLAMHELSDLTKAFPDEKRVASLISVVKMRLELSRPADEALAGAGSDHQAEGTGGAGGTGGAASGKKLAAPSLLTEEQVHLIRVLEIDLGRKPAVIVPRQTLDEVLSKYADDELRGRKNARRFRSAKGYRQLAKIFQLAGDYPSIRSLYKTIKVRSDPPSMRAFRRVVHASYLLNYCAGVGCHGSKQVKTLPLHRRKSSSDATVYTNYYLLDSYPSASRYDLIDRRNPRESLLIQYGLPRVDAIEPHPDVANWRPRLQPRRDPRVQNIIRWVSMLQARRPKYDEYGLPPLNSRAAKMDKATPVHEAAK